MKYPKPLEQMIEVFRQLPGIGLKGAERFAFHLSTQSPEKLSQSLEQLKIAQSNLSSCKSCGCLHSKQTPCDFCHDSSRNQTFICVVPFAKDVFSFEQTKEFNGLYHVLGALLSPINGFLEDAIDVDKLLKRTKELNVKELVLALDATVEGDATALYIKQVFENQPVKVTRVAFGLPLGSSLEFADGGTLARALSGRSTF